MHWWHEAEGSLIAFTLFTQAAVGAFFVLLVSDFLKRNSHDRVYTAFLRIGTAILLPLVALGLLASVTHLGRPLYFLRALTNLQTSWLSREVWAFGIFFSLVAVYTFLWWRKIEDTELRRVVGVLTGLAGLVAVWVQAQVYQIPGRPMWDHPSTTLLFFGSAFLLGPLAVAVLYNLAWGRLVPMPLGEPVVRGSHRRLGITLLVTAAVQALALFWRLQYLAGGLPGADTAYALTTGPYLPLLWGHAALSVAVPALVAVGLWVLHHFRVSLRVAGSVIAVTLALVLCGEVLGRALFYLSSVAWW